MTVQTHVDDDATEIKLAYASHLDHCIFPIDFVIPEYRIGLPIRDGNIFAFQSDVVHCRGYRMKTSNLAYVRAIIIVNKTLRRVMQN